MLLLGAFAFVQLERARLEARSLDRKLGLERAKTRAELDQLVVSLLVAALRLRLRRGRPGDERVLALAELLRTLRQLGVPFGELDPLLVEPRTLSGDVTAQRFELRPLPHGRLLRARERSRLGVESSPVRLESLFALLQIARSPSEDAVELAELRLARCERCGPGLDVHLTPRQQLFRIRLVGVGLRAGALAAEAKAVSPLAAKLRFAPFDSRVFDLELARGDLDRTLAQLALQVGELGELLVAKPLALLGEVTREPKYLVAFEVGGACEVPVVALPRVLVRLHLQGI